MATCNKTSKPKIIYFDGMGRAEVARLMLAYAGVDFDDERVPFGDEWKKMKTELDLPYGLPAFEVDGNRYCQSLAIINYIAKKYGLYGETAEEALKIDMIGQCLHDVATKLPIFEKDEKKKKEKLDELFEQTFPILLGYIERRLLPSEGFVLGPKICASDIGIQRMSEALEGMRQGCMKKYPKMKRIQEAVEKDPKIAAWIARRPKTAF